jgi:hypothetical protein
MFQLIDPTTVKLKKASTTVDTYEDTERLTLELRVLWTTSNRNLDLIRKGMREYFFCDLRPEEERAQADLDLPIDDLPNLKMPTFKYPQSDGYELMGARVEIAHGIDETSAIVLQLCKVHKFQFTPIEGGSAHIEYSISSSAELDSNTLGTLLQLQKHEITITQTMPEVEEPTRPLTEGDVFPGAPPSEPEKKLTPEDVFLGAHAPKDADGEAGEGDGGEEA